MPEQSDAAENCFCSFMAAIASLQPACLERGKKPAASARFRLSRDGASRPAKTGAIEALQAAELMGRPLPHQQGGARSLRPARLAARWMAGPRPPLPARASVGLGKTAVPPLQPKPLKARWREPP